MRYTIITGTTYNIIISMYIVTLLPISGFVLNEKFQRNASKFAISIIYENPKLLFPFYISDYFIFFSPVNDALVFVNIDQGIH